MEIYEKGMGFTTKEYEPLVQTTVITNTIIESLVKVEV